MKENKPTISIVVAIFQVEEYLNRCLESIVTQSYKNLQIILVDDGSADESSSICDRYALIDNRIEVYHKENGGLVSARKFGIEKAKGEYIAFVDGDDYLDTNMYDELLSVISDTGADVVNFGYKRVNDDGIIEIVEPNDFSFEITNVEDRKTLIYSSFFGNNRNKYIIPSIWAKLYKSSFIKACYFLVPDHQDYGEDLICLYICLSKCRKIVSINKSLYNYVLRKGSLSDVKNELYFRNELNLYIKIIDVNEKLMNGIDNRQFHTWIREKIKDLMIMTAETDNVLGVVQYYIEDVIALKGKKIIIYGAGIVGKHYCLQLSSNSICSVIGFIDKNISSQTCLNRPVYRVNDLQELDYDFIIIAMKNKDEAINVKEELINQNVASQKLIWVNPSI